MTHTHSSRGLVWLDLESPTDDEISGLIKRYDLHPLVGEELKSSSSLAKIDFYEAYILVVLTLPIRVKKDGRYTIIDRELDFVIGKNFLITSRFDTIDQLEYFAKVFDTNSILNKGEKIEHTGHLFYYIVKRLYAGMADDLENIRDSLISAESRIFLGHEHKMVEVLSGLSRELIDFKQTARIHREIWEEMVQQGDQAFFGPDFIAYMKDLRDDFTRIHELIVNARELLTDLRETNDSLLNTKQNQIIRLLTAVSVIFSPLTFIAALFTIPALHVPLITRPSGWAILVTIMILLVAAMAALFKRKGWI